MADDKQQRQQRRLEVVKMRIDVLKHITTLSGAAALILLALAERSGGIRDSAELEPVAALFGLSAVIALLFIVALLGRLEDATIPRYIGQEGTRLVVAMFAAGVGQLMIVAAGLSCARTTARSLGRRRNSPTRKPASI